MIAALRPVSLLTAATLFALPVFAQDDKPQGGQTGKANAGEVGKEVTKELQEQGEGDVAADGMVQGKTLDPNQLEKRNVVHGARGHCHFDLAVQPQRLAPGQSGVLKLTMVLEGDAVLLAPANLQPMFATEQGPLSLGPFAIRPATPGKIAAAYLGQPVYDNYAIIEIPVTMGTNAQLGAKYPVNVAFQFDLQHGKRAQPLGMFSDQARVTVECGVAPTPIVATPAATAGSAAATGANAPERPAAAPSRGGSTAPGAVDRAPAAGGHAVQGASPSLPAGNAVAPVPAHDPTSPAPPVADGGDHLLLYAGGAGVVLALLALLLLRRR